MSTEMKTDYRSRTSGQSELPFDLTRFVVLETSVALFTLFLLYSLVALLCFEWRRSRLPSVTPRGRARRSARYSLFMRVASITAVVFALGRMLCENYELIAQFAGVRFDYCDEIVKTKVTLSSIAVLSTGLFLWVRQRFCYSDPAMKHLSSYATRCISWTSLGLLFLAQFVGSALFLITRFYKLTHRGCFMFYSTIPAFLPWVFSGVVTIFSQFTLLLLFLYPLVRHKSLSHFQSLSQSLLPVIRRASATSSICSITDFISCLLILLVKDPYEITPTLAYDVSLVTNVFCVIFSFNDWKLRLFAPFCYQSQEESHEKQLSVYGRIKSLKLSGGVAPAKPSLSHSSSSATVFQPGTSQRRIIFLSAGEKTSNV